MKLVSLDSQFDGTIVEILEYRPAPAGRIEVIAIVDAPGAWYSGTYPVVLDVSKTRLLLSVQSFTRPTTSIQSWRVATDSAMSDRPGTIDN